MPLGFLGTHEYRVDAKGRIPLPPPFRERFRMGGVMSPGLEGCIRIYPLAEWEKKTEKLGAMSDATLKVRRLLRFTHALSFPVDIDGQGRIVLPIPLRQYADIQDEAVVTGGGAFLEVWSLKRWRAEKEIVMQESWQNSESLP